MLRPKIYLCKAALDHCNDQGPLSLVGHGGSDGSADDRAHTSFVVFEFTKIN